MILNVWQFCCPYHRASMYVFKKCLVRNVQYECMKLINSNSRVTYDYRILLARHSSSANTVKHNAKANSSKGDSSGKELDIARKSPYEGLSGAQKVKEATKDVGYLGISIAALAVLGGITYYIGRELFSSDSPNGVYGKAFKRCAKDSEVIIALGEPIKGYGEETHRGRRSHVSHLEFLQDGKMHMRMKFHIQGPDKKGEVNLEVVKDDNGSYQYRYLFVQLGEFPYRTIILEDNR